MKQVKSGRGAEKDDDMYGPVEDAGWDPDKTPAKEVRHPGINRKQQTLNIMDQVMKTTPLATYDKPNAQVSNIRVQGGRNSNYGDE